MSRITLFYVVLLLVTLSKAQTPNDDTKWVLHWSDEFNSTAMTDQQEMNYLNRPYGPFVPWLWFCDRYAPSRYREQDSTALHYAGKYLEFDNGNLELSVSKGPYTEHWNKDTLGHPIPYTVTRPYAGNWMQTHNTFDNVINMRYGFFEMRLRIPKSKVIDSTSGLVIHRNEGIRFAWGLYGKDTNICWSEVDFFEMSGYDNVFTHNFIYGETGQCVTGSTNPAKGLNDIRIKSIHDTITSDLMSYAGFPTDDQPNYTNPTDDYIKLGVEITPQKMTWFLNDKFLQSTTGAWYHINGLKSLPTMEMGISMTAGDNHDADLINDNNATDYPTANTMYPFTAEIDYVRYYKYKQILDIHTCQSTVSMIEDPTISFFYSLSELEQAVYKTIEIGATSPGYRITGNTTLRATDYIELLPGFGVASGAQFYADVHDCNF